MAMSLEEFWQLGEYAPKPKVTAPVEYKGDTMSNHVCTFDSEVSITTFKHVTVLECECGRVSAYLDAVVTDNLSGTEQSGTQYLVQE